VPKTEGKYWLPTASDITELESGLTTRLELRDSRGQPVPPKFQQFQRQYIGFVRNGERLIYGNFSSIYDDKPWHQWSFLERPTIVCDGGRHFWGIIYNAKTREFEEPQFNGDA
jgi:hypothetical protein